MVHHLAGVTDVPRTQSEASKAQDEKQAKLDNIDELIAKSEEYRRDLAARQLQEDKEKDDKDNAGSAE